jgi:polar amino acid transport system substrate-binding protein
MRIVLLVVLLFSSLVAQKELKVGFPKPIPPYTFENSTGIEVELFRAIMEPYGYEIKPIIMSYKRGKKSVQKGLIDAMSTMKVIDDNCYYSDEYIRYHNYAIALKDKNLKIASMQDLKGKSIITWQDAHTMLGKEFYDIFNPNVKESYIKKYREILDQGQQNRLFWADRVDIIILDEMIFKYYKKLYKNEFDTSKDVVMYNIIGDYTGYSIAFKDKKLQLEYNKGLKKIKQNGTYKKIFDKYIK